MKTTLRKIYVASSWRNGYYPEVVEKLREAGHEVYDFRNPPSGDPGFKWSSVSEDYMEWSPAQYRDMLQHPKAVRQFHNDIEAMEACNTSRTDVQAVQQGVLLNRRTDRCIEVRWINSQHNNDTPTWRLFVARTRSQR